MGSRIVEVDLRLLGVEVWLTRGREPWLALSELKHGDVSVFYRRELIDSTLAFMVAGEMLLAAEMEWPDAGRRVFATTVVGARKLQLCAARLKDGDPQIGRPIVAGDTPLVGTGKLA